MKLLSRGPCCRHHLAGRKHMINEFSLDKSRHLEDPLMGLSYREMLLHPSSSPCYRPGLIVFDEFLRLHTNG